MSTRSSSRQRAGLVRSISTPVLQPPFSGGGAARPIPAPAPPPAKPAARRKPRPAAVPALNLSANTSAGHNPATNPALSHTSLSHTGSQAGGTTDDLSSEFLPARMSRMELWRPELGEETRAELGLPAPALANTSLQSAPDPAQGDTLDTTGPTDFVRANMNVEAGRGRGGSTGRASAASSVSKALTVDQK